MGGRQKLVDDWRRQLAEWRRRSASDRSARPWLGKIYTRVLSYLLARYGAGESHAKTEPDDEGSAGRSPMVYRAVAPHDGGKPPRGGAEIRKVLAAVHQNQAKPPEPGPLSAGLTPDAPLAVAGFYNRYESERLRWILGWSGIGARTQRLRRQFQVVIRAADRERAWPIIARHAAEAHDSSRLRVAYGKAWSSAGASLGGLVGAAIGVVVCLATSMYEPPPMVVISLLFAYALGAAGWLAGLILGMIADS